MYNDETNPIPSQQRTNGTTKEKTWRIVKALGRTVFHLTRSCFE